MQEGSNITKENTTYIHTTYKDNIDNLSESYIQQIEQMRERRPEKYKQQTVVTLDISGHVALDT